MVEQAQERADSLRASGKRPPSTAYLAVQVVLGAFHLDVVMLTEGLDLIYYRYSLLRVGSLGENTWRLRRERLRHQIRIGV